MLSARILQQTLPWELASWSNILVWHCHVVHGMTPLVDFVPETDVQTDEKPLKSRTKTPYPMQ